MKEQIKTSFGKWAGLALAVSCTAFAGHQMSHARNSANPVQAVPASRISTQPAASKAQLVFSHSLPPMDGSRLQVKMVEVTYRPGESSPPHSHPCPVIGYVIEGAVRMKVEGENEVVYKAGEAFYEAPGGVHLVSANASRTEPAKFVAYFTCDRDTPLSVPVHESTHGGGKRK